MHNGCKNGQQPKQIIDNNSNDNTHGVFNEHDHSLIKEAESILTSNRMCFNCQACDVDLYWTGNRLKQQFA